MTPGFFDLKPLNSSIPLERQKEKWMSEFLKTFCVIFTVYFVSYIIRQNMNAAQVEMMREYKIGRNEISNILIFYSVSYGIGKTVFCLFVDGKNTKKISSFLLMIGGICNVIVGIILWKKVSVNMMMWSVSFLWGLNGLVLSPGASCSYSTIMRWMPKSQQATWMGRWNVALSLGGASGALIAVYFANKLFQGRSCGYFLIPGFVATITGVWGMFFGADDPSELGWNNAACVWGEVANETSCGTTKSTEGKEKKTEKVEPNKWNSFVAEVLKNPWVLLLASANVLVYVVRLGITAWLIPYANLVLGHSVVGATGLLATFEASATVGSMLLGWLSDRVKGRRMLISAATLAMTCVGIRLYSTAVSMRELYGAMFACGFFVFGPQMLVGVSIVKFVPRRVVAVAYGFAGTAAYLLGDSLLAKKILPVYVVGARDTWENWQRMFVVMYAAVGVGTLLMLVVACGEERCIRAEEKEKKGKGKEEEKVFAESNEDEIARISKGEGKSEKGLIVAREVCADEDVDVTVDAVVSPAVLGLEGKERKRRHTHYRCRGEEKTPTKTRTSTTSPHSSESLKESLKKEFGGRERERGVKLLQASH